MDSRIFALIVVAVIALILLIALPRGPFGGDDGAGPPGGACPPGQVTATGCAKP
jgi:hypothetical protein